MALDDYRVARIALSSHDVFDLLCDDRRFIDEFAEWTELTRQSPVMDLHVTYGTPDYRELGKALNRQFSIEVSKRQWMSVLYPARRHTVGGVCDFIAERASRLVIAPLDLCGSVSSAAGAFLAVRQILRDMGADVSALRPSSPLGPYLCRYPDFFLSASHLAPSRLPKPQVIAPVHAGLGVCALGCGLASVVCRCFGAWAGAANCLLATSLLCWVALFIAARTVRPVAVHLSWLRDFRDLCRVLAGERDGNWPGFEVLPAGPPGVN